MTNDRRILKSPLALALAALTLGQYAPAVMAQDSGSSFQLEEITVTARKREENLSDIPFSIAVQTEENLRTSGAVDMESMSRNVAGLTVQNLGPGQSQVAIRGISAGQIVRDQPGVKEQVGVYLDESVISASLFTPDLDFYDVNRVEVLRGPQGTLFGAGSLSGTVRYISNKPELDEFSGSVDGTVLNVEDGSMGGDVKGMLNLPMGGAAALRLVAYYDVLPGYIDAIRPLRPRGHTGFDRDDDVNDGVRQGVRATLLLQPTEDLEIIPRVVYQDVEIDGMNRVDEFNIFANPYATARRTPDLDDRAQFTQLTEKFEDEMTLGDLTINWTLGDLVLTSVTSYTERDILMLRDATQLTGSITGQPGVLSATGYGPEVYFLDAPLDDSTDIEMTTQEVRLASDSGEALQWVVGAFWSEIERQYSQSLLVNGFEERTGIPTTGVVNPKNVLFYSDIPYELEQQALFGELNYQATDRLSLTGGLRWFSYDEERTLNFDGIFADRTIGLDGETDSDGYSPRVIARYDVNDGMQVNAQVSKGFRLGGINDPLNKPLCSAEDLATFGGFDAFEDEELTNYEVGAKMDLMDGRSQVNLAVYYSEIEDLQATLDAGTCSSRIVYNVPDAHVQGVEFEWFTTPVDGLDLALTGTWTQEAELDSTVTSTDAAGNITVLGGLEEGNQLPTAPEFQMAASLTYSWPFCCTGIEGFVNGTWQYVGERWTQFADQDASGVVTMIPLASEPLSQATYAYDPEMDSYDLLNLRFGMRCDTWEAALFVNNALDEDAELALDRERGFRARQGYLTNQPRTVGLTGRYMF